MNINEAIDWLENLSLYDGSSSSVRAEERAQEVVTLLKMIRVGATVPETDNSALWPTLLELRMTNPLVRTMMDIQTLSLRGHNPQSTATMLAQLLARMDQHNDELTNRLINMMAITPTTYTLPGVSP